MQRKVALRRDATELFTDHICKMKCFYVQVKLNESQTLGNQSLAALKKTEEFRMLSTGDSL